MKRRNLGNCIVEGCDRSARVRELCSAHYMRSWTGKPLTGPIGKRGRVPKFPGIDRRVMKIWSNVDLRCNYSGTHKFEYYGGRGIRNLLTPYDVQFLWERDHASEMLRPSIDRKHGGANYTLKECRFIEFRENISRSWKRRKRERIAKIRASLAHHFLSQPQTEVA